MSLCVCVCVGDRHSLCLQVCVLLRDTHGFLLIYTSVCVLSVRCVRPGEGVCVCVGGMSPPLCPWALPVAAYVSTPQAWGLYRL